MQVKKRDGSYQPVRLDAITSRISNLCWGLDVDPVPIATQVAGQLCDGMTTAQLDQLASEACAAMMTDNIGYEVLASRLVVSNLHKTTSESILETYESMSDVLDPGFLETIRANAPAFQDMVRYERDYQFSFFAMRTLLKLYLGRSGSVVLERPQHMYLRVAVCLYGCDLPNVQRVYEELSTGLYIHASPCLFNAGSKKQQLSSCFLLTMQDDLNDILDCFKDMAMVSKHGGGLGCDIGSIRGRNAPIMSSGGSSDGLVPLLKTTQELVRWVNQSGRRKGSCCTYIEPWHSDVMDYLRMKLNSGDENMRARDLFYALWVNDLFMERVLADGEWTLFHPNLAPGLTDAHGPAFDELYTKYERDGVGVQTVRARDVWNGILRSQCETGTPFVLFKDACNAKSNQSHLGTIRCSNLCTEIVEFTSDEEVAVCTLASLSLPAFVKKARGGGGDGGGLEFDYEALGAATRSLVDNLNRVIDVTYYPCSKAHTSNMRHRPLGIGIQGLADLFIKLRLPFQSEGAAALNEKIAACMYFNALQRSCELAQSVGPHSSFPGSPASQGRLQFDLWGAQGHPDFDWSALKDAIKEHGLRNSLLIAPMPTASTSQLLGNNQSFEPHTSLVYMRRTAAGDYPVVVKELVEDLQELGLWSTEMRNHIISLGGSVQDIPSIPKELREIYMTAYEVPQRTLIDLAVSRGRYVCQSQSLSLFFNAPVNPSKLSAALFHGWRSGIKTGMYYCYSRAAVRGSQTSVMEAPTPACVSCEG